MREKFFEHVFCPWLLAALAAALAVYSQWPALVLPYVHNNDASQQSYWFAQFRDPGLFPGDLLTKFAKHFVPPGYVIFYRGVSFFADPFWVSKWMPVILFPVSVLGLYFLTRVMGGGWMGGSLASVVFMITPFYIKKMSGGLPRAFAFPLLAWFLVFLCEKKYARMTGIWVAQCFFYPMIFAVSLLTYGMTLLRFQSRRPWLDVSGWPRREALAGGLLGILLVAGACCQSVDPEIGRLVTYRDMEGQAEYYLAGRTAILPVPPVLMQVAAEAAPAVLKKIAFYRYARPGKKIWLPAFFMIFDAWLMARRQLMFSREILSLAVSSLILYVLADIFLIRMYVPDRYLQYSVKLGVLVLLGIAAGQMIRSVFRSSALRGPAAGVLFSLLLVPNFQSIQGMGLEMPGPAVRRMCEYLRTYPKDVLIAAHPHEADDILLLSQRKVWVNYELSNTLYDRYWATVKKRIFDFFDAYYAQDLGEVLEFMEKNDVDLFVVRRRHFRKFFLREGKFYFRPFRDHVRRSIRRQKRFALMEIPPQQILYEDRNYFIVSRAAVRTLVQGPEAKA